MDFTERRSEILAEYVLETGATVRVAAAHFGISKSTVHKDLTVRLRYENQRLYQEVAVVLARNKSERHLRGGEATRLKYQKARTEREKHVRP